MPDIDALMKNLTNQLSLYRQLTEIAEAKKEALVKNDIEELQAIISQEEPLVLEGTNFEKERQAIVDNIAESLGISSKDLTISVLVNHYPELSSIRDQLDKAITDFKDIHDLNTDLLKNAVNIVNYTINMLTAPQGKGLYNRPGEKEHATGQQLSFLDRSI